MPYPSVHIRSLSEFVDKTTTEGTESRARLFRGQPVQGNLLPSAVRGNPRIDTTASERKALDQLGLLGASMLPSHAQNRLELLVLAQHFGLHTRLLDWTSNPLTALWFACAARESGDVYVYELAADELLAANAYEEDPFAAVATRVFQPRLSNERILAQNDWFTLHRWSPKGKRFVPLGMNPRTKKNLKEYIVPAESRKSTIAALDLLGLNHRTLFPDLAGLCSYLNWRGAA